MPAGIKCLSNVCSSRERTGAPDPLRYFAGLAWVESKRTLPKRVAHSVAIAYPNLHTHKNDHIPRKSCRRVDVMGGPAAVIDRAQ